MTNRVTIHAREETEDMFSAIDRWLINLKGKYEKQREVEKT